MQRATSAVAGGADRNVAAQGRVNIHAVIFGARHQLIGEHDIVGQGAMRQGVPMGPFIELAVIDNRALAAGWQHAPHPEAAQQGAGQSLGVSGGGFALWAGQQMGASECEDALGLVAMLLQSAF